MTERSVLSSGLVMAAGTMVSRMSGYLRSVLLVAALGSALHADIFSIANTVPNMLYILLAGGVFNAVLVPQLVRAQKHDPDGGAAYTNRIVTLAALFLLGVTVLLVVLAPLLMQLYLDDSFDQACLADQRESVVDFARFCLPQVFFYGMFVLVGQILNARGSFGPMMWAPIANNVIAIAVLLVYLLAFGSAQGAELVGGFTPGQEALLGIGSTLGIAAQLLILLPYLKRAGFTFRPRFDFRDAGLGHTLRLGVWTVAFVIVNQIAYTVVVRLASSGTASVVSCSGTATSGDATGYTVYSSSFLLAMVPHSIVTVSLATAILPALSRHATDDDLAGLGRTLAGTLRTVLALIVPFALLMPVVASDVANLVYGWGAGRAESFAPSLALFGAGVLFFTIHYLVLRGFYALERNRTAFWVQCVIAGVNIVLAVVLVRATDAEHTSPALVMAYTGAYAVGAATSYAVLLRLVGDLETPRLVRFLVRAFLAAGVAAAVAWVVMLGVDAVLGEDRSKGAAVLALAVAGVVAGVSYLGMARLLRLREVNELVATVTRRVGRG